MDVDSAATFLSCAILFGAGFAILGITVIFLNNIVHKYWKPVRIFTADSWAPFNGLSTTRFAEPHEVEPVNKTVDKTVEPKLK
jgi:hypothetical protein